MWRVRISQNPSIAQGIDLNGGQHVQTHSRGAQNYSSVQSPSLGGPTPDQPQDISCEGLNAERARLLAARDDLKSPLLSSNTDAGREAELTQLNGRLYMVAKAQFDKGCPAVANASPTAVVR